MEIRWSNVYEPWFLWCNVYTCASKWSQWPSIWNRSCGCHRGNRLYNESRGTSVLRTGDTLRPYPNFEGRRSRIPSNGTQCNAITVWLVGGRGVTLIGPIMYLACLAVSSPPPRWLRSPRHSGALEPVDSVSFTWHFLFGPVEPEDWAEPSLG